MVWNRSGIVRRFTWMHSCIRTLFLHLSLAFQLCHVNLKSPLSLKQPTTLTLAHWHAIVQSASKIQITVVIPFGYRRDIDGSVILPLLSTGTQGAYFFCRTGSNWDSSRRVASPIAKLVSPRCLSRSSPVYPGCHPVYSRVSNGQCLGEVMRNSYRNSKLQVLVTYNIYIILYSFTFWKLWKYSLI